MSRLGEMSAKVRLSIGILKVETCKIFVQTIKSYHLKFDLAQPVTIDQCTTVEILLEFSVCCFALQWFFQVKRVLAFY
jgi:hypothetical protein